MTVDRELVTLLMLQWGVSKCDPRVLAVELFQLVENKSYPRFNLINIFWWGMKEGCICFRHPLTCLLKTY